MIFVSLNIFFYSNHYTNTLDMLSVLINVITSTESTTNQLADDGRKFSTGLFKKMKVYKLESWYSCSASSPS